MHGGSILTIKWLSVKFAFWNGRKWKSGRLTCRSPECWQKLESEHSTRGMHMHSGHVNSLCATLRSSVSKKTFVSKVKPFCVKDRIGGGRVRWQKSEQNLPFFKDCNSKLPWLLSPPLWLAWSSPLLARHGPQVCSICLNDPYWRAWNDFEQLKIFFSDAWTTQEQTRYKDKHQTVLQSPRKPRAFQEDDHAMWVAKAHPKQFSTFCNLFSFWTLNRRSFPEHIKWFFTTNNNNTKTRIMTSAIWNIYKMYCGIDFYQLLLRQLSFVKNCSAKHCRKQGWI